MAIKIADSRTLADTNEIDLVPRQPLFSVVEVELNRVGLGTRTERDGILGYRNNHFGVGLVKEIIG